MFALFQMMNCKLPRDLSLQLNNLLQVGVLVIMTPVVVLLCVKRTRLSNEHNSGN